MSSPTALRVIITLWTIGLILASFVIAFSLQLMATALAYLFVDKYKLQQINGTIFRWVSCIVTFFNPFWRVKRVGPRPKFPRSYMIMANHLGNADPFILCPVIFPTETKYIAKAGLFSIPLGGWAMKLAGDIPVYFTKEKGGWGTQKGSVGRMMEHCKELFKRGIPITIFPEGARSPTGELQDFRLGFFTLAVETGTPIVPLAHSGAENAWPFGDSLLERANVTARFGEPITPLKDETPEQLRDRVKAAIAALITELPPITIRKSAFTWEKHPSSESKTAADATPSSKSD